MFEDFLSYVKSQKFYDKQIVHIEHIPSKSAKYGGLDIPLHSSLMNWLINNNFRLWSHQADAINSIFRGKNVVIATSTSSGKSLCYNLPVLSSILNDMNGTALYLFPRKALTQDQYTELIKIMSEIGLGTGQAGVYDGDTNPEEKIEIRQNANIIMTNPYALHQYLAHFRRIWYRFCKNLKYIVIDEVHLYKGVFGTNIAFLIRRLKRILNYYNVNPQWILCSATINDPKSFAKTLTGESFELVENDGSPSGIKKVILWDLPYDDLDDTYRSGITESQYLFRSHLEKGIQTLMFTLTRKTAELQAKWTKSELPIRNRVSTYRAGLSKKVRRNIERGLKSKKFLGVCSTNALELGIDIGTLEATITAGFPRSISSFMQQIGRSGRGENFSISTLVPYPNPLDFFYVHNPNVLFGPIREKLLINLNNIEILKKQIRCAAFEMPITKGDNLKFGIEDAHFFNECLEELIEKSYLKGNNDKFYSTEKNPSQTIGIDNLSDITYSIFVKRKSDNSYKLLTTDDEEHVYRDLHPEAIYLYNSEQYYVERIDFDKREVFLLNTDKPYYTVAVTDTEIERLKINTQKKMETLQNLEIFYGKVKVTQTISSYNKLKHITQEVIDSYEICMPPLKFNTQALWILIPNKFIEIIEQKGLDIDNSLHAIMHALINMVPVLAQIDRYDIDGAYSEEDTEYQRPIIYLFDTYKEGIGISERVFEKIEDLFLMTYQLIKKCSCSSRKGCPACIMTPKCPRMNDALDKKGALKLLELILGDLLGDLKVKGPVRESKDTNKMNIKPKEDKIHKTKILILKLKDGKYYVGKSDNVKGFIQRIKGGNGPRWTRIHKFVSVYKTIDSDDLKTATLDAMKEFGWENVRGYAWSQVNMKRPPRILRKGKLLNEVSKKQFAETVYILKLQKGKWFLGKCLNYYLTRRIKRYTDGRGNDWIKTYNVLSVERFVENGDLKKLTLEYMKKYGWENVRGYSWTKKDMKKPPKELNQSC